MVAMSNFIYEFLPFKTKKERKKQQQKTQKKCHRQLSSAIEMWFNSVIMVHSRIKFCFLHLNCIVKRKKKLWGILTRLNYRYLVDVCNSSLLQLQYEWKGIPEVAVLHFHILCGGGHWFTVLLNFKVFLYVFYSHHCF